MDNESLFRARQLTDEYAALLRSVTGRRVRVLRAVVFEGDGEAVIQQLAGSLPVGTREAHKGALTITVTQGEIEVLDPKPDPQPMIEVCRLDPDTLVGIAPCGDGSGGWVMMRQDGEGNAEPVGDDHGEIVYTDIQDAAAVLRTGIVWKHDMGEGEATDDPDSGPLDVGPATLPVILHTSSLLTGGVRIQYTATYRLSQTGEARVTTLWAQPDSTRERLISLLRRALAHAAAKQGVKLSTHEIAEIIDPDSYVFDPPAPDAPTPPGPAT